MPKVGSVSERTLGQPQKRVFYTRGVTSIFFHFTYLMIHLKIADLCCSKNDVTLVG